MKPLGETSPGRFTSDQVIAGWRRHVTEARLIDKIRTDDVIGWMGAMPTHF